MKRLLLVQSIVALSAILPAAAEAGTIYGAQVTLQNPCGTNGGTTCTPESANVTFTTAESLINFFTDQNLAKALPNYYDYSQFGQGYSNGSIINSVVTFQGLPIDIAFPTSGTLLTFKVPSLGINESFQGATRDDSTAQLLDFIKGHGFSIINQLEHALFASSPISPVAGNPNSLESRQVGASFANDGFGSDNNASVGPGGVKDSTNRFSLGFSAGSFSSGGVTGHSIGIEPGYTLRYVDDPRYQLSFDMPLSYTDTQGAKSGAFAFGVGFQFPLAHNWYLTPRVTYGLAGSVDLAAAAQMLSETVTSRYVFYPHATFMGNHLQFTLANMIGYSSSLALHFQNYSYDPSLSNLVTKNGFMVEEPLDFELFGRQASVQANYAYTRFFGTKLYLQDFHEIGLTIGTRTNGRHSFLNLLRLGVLGTFGAHYQSATVSFGYIF